MLSRHQFAVLIPLVLIAGTAAAQERTDFSGRWTTDPEPAAVEPGGRAGGGERGGGAARGRGAGGRGGRGDMGPGWGSTITITQNPSQLVVEYTFFGRGDMQPPLRFTYALDGSPSKNSVMMGRGIQVQTSTAKWDGAALIIVTTHQFDNPATGKREPATVTQRLTLESPTSLVVETTRAGVLGGPDVVTKTTYRKI
jgi:hypothetical protein